MAEEKRRECCLICGKVTEKTTEDKKSDYCPECEKKFGEYKNPKNRRKPEQAVEKWNRRPWKGKEMKIMPCWFCKTDGAQRLVKDRKNDYITMFIMVCDVNRGGCGVSCGYWGSPEEAIEEWNKCDTQKGKTNG